MSVVAAGTWSVAVQVAQVVVPGEPMVHPVVLAVLLVGLMVPLVAPLGGLGMVRQLVLGPGVLGRMMQRVPGGHSHLRQGVLEGCFRLGAPGSRVSVQ